MGRWGSIRSIVSIGEIGEIDVTDRVELTSAQKGLKRDTN